MSRGTTRRSARGRRTRTVPNSSRSVTTTRPSGPPSKPPLRLRSTSAMAPGGGGLREPVDDRRGMPGLAEEVGQARRLVGREDDPRPVRPPGVDRLGQPGRPAGRQDGLAPAEQVAGRQRRRGPSPPPPAGPDSQVSSSVRDADEPALPVARRQVGRRPVLRQLAGLDRARARRSSAWRHRNSAASAMSPGSSRTRSVPGADVVEAGRRGEVRRPDLGGVADGDGPGRVGRGARPARMGRRGHGSVALEPGQVRRRAARAVARRGPAQALADRRGAARRQQELGRRQEHGRSTASTVRWSVGSNARSESISSPKNSIRIGSGIDGGKTSTMPPRRANSPRPATSSDRHVAEVEQVVQQRVLVEPGAAPRARAARRQVVRRDRVLEERLDAGDEDPGAAAPPGGQGRDAGGRLVGDQLAALVGERRPRLQRRRRPPGRRATRRAPRRRGRRSRRRGRSRRAARRRRPWASAAAR